jgi:voltage-gated potassium channel
MRCRECAVRTTPDIDREAVHRAPHDPAGQPAASDAFVLFRARLQILRQIEKALDTPMAILGLAWLALMVVDLVRGLGPVGAHAATFIWVVFVFDFLLRFMLAPRKLRFARANWLTLIALLLPALRIVRFARLLRGLARLRGLQLVRIAASVNRGMKALGRTLRRRGFGYVLGLTVMVTFAGAAGMLYFERQIPQASLQDFWTALWWTAMVMTTMGSEYWPKTAEGRTLCLFLAIYAFAVFSYVTGTIATYFIGRDADEEKSDAALQEQLERLAAEVAALRDEVRKSKEP